MRSGKANSIISDIIGQDPVQIKSYCVGCGNYGYSNLSGVLLQVPYLYDRAVAVIVVLCEVGHTWMSQSGMERSCLGVMR